MSAARARPHRGATALLAVGVGGGLGTLARAGVDVAVADVWSTAVVNLAGGFALGVLLELLARGPAMSDRRERVRLLLGTGFLGGFTTYSALAVQVATMMPAAPTTAVGYGLGLVVVGVGAAGAGAAAGAGLHRCHARRRPAR